MPGELRAICSPLGRFLVVILLAVALLAAPVLLGHHDYIYAGLQVSITRTFQPSSIDSWMDGSSTQTNYGTGTFIQAQSGSGGAKNDHGIVQFDISEVATNSTGISATLSLNISATPAATRSYEANRVTTGWTEAGVTWKRYDGGNWGTAGGDFNAATDTQSTSGMNPGDWIDWNVQPDVSAFNSGAATNYGWVIKDSVEGSATTYNIQFYSLDSGGDTPKLAVTFTAPWDSYETDLRTVVRDTFNSSYTTVFMKGTGFANDNYNVAYYDGSGNFVDSEDNILVDTGTLDSQYLLSTDPLADSGTWHALVQPAGAGYTTFDSSYDTVIAAPDTYGLVANDAFDVQPSAIPEFSTVFAAIGVIGLCFGIYYWMRKRVYNVQVVRPGIGECG